MSDTITTKNNVEVQTEVHRLSNSAEVESSNITSTFDKGWYQKLFRTHGKRTVSETKFVRKLDFYLLTWGCIAYTIKSIDQSNYSNAYVSGMKEDLNFHGKDYNWLNSFFTIGYAVGLLPAQYFMTQIKTQYWLSSCETIWGILTLCCSLVDYGPGNPVKKLFFLRFFIGLLESSSWPGVMTIFYNYYAPGELATRAALFSASYYAGTMFTGFMQAAIYKNMDGHGGLAGWKWLFIFNGIMTVIIGISGVFFIPSPSSEGGAFWMKQEDLDVANERMERLGRKTTREFNLKKVSRLLLDYRMWLFMLAYVPAQWLNGETYFNLWLKSLTNEDGSQKYSVEQLNLIPIAGAATQLVTVVVFAKLADLTGKRLPVMIFENLVGFTGTVILACWPKSVGVKYFAFFLLYSRGANPPILVSFVAEVWPKDSDLRAMVTGIIVLMIYANNSWIPLLIWPANEAPLYKYGYKVTAVFLAASLTGIVTFYVFGYKRTIRKRTQNSQLY